MNAAPSLPRLDLARPSFVFALALLLANDDWSNAFSPCADDIRLRARVVDFGATSLLQLEQVDSECQPGAEVRTHVVPEINRQLLGLGMRPGKFVPPRDSVDPKMICTEEDMARAREKGWLNCLRVE